MSYMQRSPWVIHFDGTGCRGCGSEVKACYAPSYDFEKEGIQMTDNPKHADILLVTGLIDNENVDKLVRIYENMLMPKAVVAAGSCACSAGMFEECESIIGGTDSTIPVDVYIPGCASRPEVIIEGIIKSLDKIQNEQENSADESGSNDKKESQEENEDE